MSGALTLSHATDLLVKFQVEAGKLKADPFDAYSALNALRDGFHLREWTWHTILDGNPTLQATIFSGMGEANWNLWVKNQFPDFELVRELCHGSKHFVLTKMTPTVTQTHKGGFGMEDYDTTPFDLLPPGFNVVSNGAYKNVNQIVEQLLLFWGGLFVANGW